MDTSLDPKPEANDRSHPTTIEPTHALPAKPPVAQEPSLLTGSIASAEVADIATETPGQLGKVSDS